MERRVSRKKRPLPRLEAVAPTQVPSRRPGPKGGVRDQNRQERTRVIAQAALRLFLERGLEAVTIDEITARAGVAKGSFYRYFADKTALVDALFLPLASGVDDALSRCQANIDAAEGRAALSVAYERLGLELGGLVLMHRDVLHLYLIERRGPAQGARVPVRRMADALEARAETLTGRARERGLLRPFNARVSSLAVVGAGEQMLYAYLSGKDLGDLTQIPAQITSLIMDGVRAR